MPRTSPRRFNSKKRSSSTSVEEEQEEEEEVRMWSSKKKRSNKDSGSSSNYTSSGGSLSNSGINMSAVEKMFAEIADNDDPQTANMEGIFALGEKLNMDATEDIRILVLLWKMKVRDKPSQMSKEEWIVGCKSLHADSWDKFRALIPSLDTGFLDASEFKDFYKFCFTFSRQGTHKSLENDLVVALLKLVLLNNNNNNNGNSRSSLRVQAGRVESFATFLEKNSSSYTHISLDQWTSFLDFCMEIQEDLSNYDESTSAWPVILDEYVEYMEGQM